MVVVAEAIWGGRSGAVGGSAGNAVLVAAAAVVEALAVAVAGLGAAIAAVFGLFAGDWVSVELGAAFGFAAPVSASAELAARFAWVGVADKATEAEFTSCATADGAWSAATADAEAASSGGETGSDAANALASDALPLGVTAAMDFSGPSLLLPPPQAESPAQAVTSQVRVFLGRSEGDVVSGCGIWYFMVIGVSLAFT